MNRFDSTAPVAAADESIDMSNPAVPRQRPRCGHRGPEAAPPGDPLARQRDGRGSIAGRPARHASGTCRLLGQGGPTGETPRRS